MVFDIVAIVTKNSIDWDRVSNQVGIDLPCGLAQTLVQAIQAKS